MNARAPALKYTVGRTLTPKEEAQRASAFACLADDKAGDCTKVMWTSIFFDGTNNNLERDKLDNSYSNIVVLYNTHKNKEQGDYYPYYIPGVGTPFPEIGELKESSQGKSMAAGGEDRILYAMIQVFNAVHRVITNNQNMVTDAEARKALATLGTLSWKDSAGDAGRKAYFLALLVRLKVAILFNSKPKIKLINLSVFGFSRGAAQARTFSNWFYKYCAKGDDTFCDIPIRFQFMGLFDTVASVGLADSSPVGSGFMGWADGTMDIPTKIEKVVHFVAGHEVRQNFPLSTARKGSAYPDNCIEVVYPGAHSDVGGGYGPREQGKAALGRPHLVSQVPLLDMASAAYSAGVPIMSDSELAKSGNDKFIKDFKCAPEMLKLFNTYNEFAGIYEDRVENILEKHMRIYWRWRLKINKYFLATNSYKAAPEQDKKDMKDGNDDFNASLNKVINDHETQGKPVAKSTGAKTHLVASPFMGGVVAVSALKDLVYDFVERSSSEKISADVEQKMLDDLNYNPGVSYEVDDFFDRHIHDSHSSFRLLGPLTLEEKLEAIDQVLAKNRKGEHLNPLEQDVLKLRLANEKNYPNEKYARTNAEKIHIGEFPVMTDADLKDLREMMGKSSYAVRLVTKGRRESGSFLRLRKVFDKS